MTAIKLKNEFLFGLVITLSASWLYLLDYILVLSSSDNTARELLVLSAAHSILLAYLILSIILLYLNALNSDEIYQSKFFEKLRGILIGTWPLSYFFVVINLGLFELVEAPSAILLIVTNVGILFISIYFVAKKLAPKTDFYKEALIATYGIFFFTCIIFWVLFTCVMSVAFSDVAIDTDKNYYEPGDPIRVFVQGTGYIFLPYIRSIEILGEMRKASEGIRTTNALVTSEVPESFVVSGFGTRQAYIIVDYEPQLTGSILKKYINLRIGEPMSRLKL